MCFCTNPALFRRAALRRDQERRIILFYHSRQKTWPLTANRLTITKNDVIDMDVWRKTNPLGQVYRAEADIQAASPAFSVRKEQKMSIRSANRCLLWMTVVTFIAASAFHIPNTVLSELIPKVAALGILVFMAKRDGVSDIPSMLAFHALPISTVGLCFLYYTVSYPSMAVMGMVSSLFTSRLASMFGANAVKQSFLESMICTAVLPSLYEEILLRGMVFQSHRKTGRVRAAVLLSALLFGLLHMNVWQLAYTFVAGIFLTLIVEASGSLWSSILVHFCYNMTAVVLSFISGGGSGESGGSSPMLILVFVVAAAAGIAFSIPLLKRIRSSVGRDVLTDEGSRPELKLVTPALVVFMAACIVINIVSALAILFPSAFSLPG